jgi:hypothetical protein
MALSFRYKNEINCSENYHSASAFHRISSLQQPLSSFRFIPQVLQVHSYSNMKAIFGLIFVIYCVAAEHQQEQPAVSEPVKQEKRSLSHGALDLGASYGGGIVGGPSPGWSGSAIVGGPSAGWPGSYESAAPILPEAPLIPETVALPAPAPTISTNTNTHTHTNTLLKQNVPLPYPVYKTVTVDRPV